MTKDFLNKVYGYDHIKEELFTIHEWLTDKSLLSDKETYLPKGILLHGRPGCGKTMIVRLYSDSFDCPVYNLAGKEDEISEIHDTFEEARKNNGLSIIIIDELDTMVNNNPSVQRAIQSEMDGINQVGRILILATANKISNFDEPLLRRGRFDRVIKIRTPNRSTLEKIFINTFETLNIDYSDLDLYYVTRMMDNKSGADVKTLCYDLWLRSKNQKPTMDDFEKSFEAVLGNINDLSRFSASRNKTTAIHEAGHIVSLLKYRENFEFFKAYFEEDGAITKWITKFEADTKSTKLQRLRISLSGLAAERLINKSTDIGGSSDLDCAYDIAKRLIDKSCCEGIDSFVSAYSDAFVDRTDSIIHQRYNEKKIIRLVNKCYNESYQYLKKNKKLVMRIANFLYENGQIRNRDIESLSL